MIWIMRKSWPQRGDARPQPLAPSPLADAGRRLVMRRRRRKTTKLLSGNCLWGIGDYYLNTITCIAQSSVYSILLKFIIQKTFHIYITLFKYKWLLDVGVSVRQLFLFVQNKWSNQCLWCQLNMYLHNIWIIWLSCNSTVTVTSKFYLLQL